MAAPFTWLGGKAEAAFKSLIDALAISGLTVNRGIEEDGLTLPYVIVYASEGGEESFLDSGIETMTVRIRVATSADDHDVDTHHQIAGQVFDAVRQDDIADQLSSAGSDFHCYEAVLAGRETEIEGRKLISTLILDCALCGVDMA